MDPIDQREANLISGNGTVGIICPQTEISVSGNLIGVDITGLVELLEILWVVFQSMVTTI